ncbi:MAG: hypothetical protein EA377_11320 [Phycisphaerales bacterium]|nr:MAG: hypothetical protein EA377_11320 [Phycisphaerales bacterium]
MTYKEGNKNMTSARFTLSIGAISALMFTASSLGSGLILNEWNAVGSQKWLGNPSGPSSECPNPEGPAGEDCADNDDTFFGRVQGNGGNWIELVVTEDNLDIRGWEFRWAETGNLDGDGTDYWWGNGTVRHGIIFFSEDELWSNLRAGTIITITEATTDEGGLDTDVTFDPCNGDWWINVNSYDKQYITTVHNRPDRPDGYFSVDNDDWQGRIVNAGGTQVFGPIGEAVSGWVGGGINSREIGELIADPSRNVSISDYDDGSGSTFNQPNRWTTTVGFNPLVVCRKYQDFSNLRTWTFDECPCSRVILNEYNAVREDRFLNGGDENGDEDGGFAQDTFFGRVMGNGGNWFELVAVDDVDMRGWVLEWAEVRDDTEGQIFLSDDPFWSAIPAGTIITFIENTTSEGGLDTNVDFTLPGGNWININTFDTQYVETTTSNVSSPTWGEGFTAYTNGETGNSFGIRERGETDLQDSRLFYEFMNNTGDIVVGFNVSYDVECWYHGQRANRIRLKYNNATSGFGSIDDIVSTDNPLGPGGPGAPVDGSLPENRVEVSVTIDLVDLGFAPIGVGQTSFLRWQYSNADGDGGNPRSGLGINNLVVEPILAGGGVGASYTQNFNNYLGSEATLPAEMFVTGEDGDGNEFPGSFDPFTGVSNINNADELVPGQFRTSNRDWMLTIFDDQDALVYGPAGQGAPGWTGRGVNTLNTGILEEDPRTTTLPGSNHNESIMSTFGGPNMWPTCTSPQQIVTQDFTGIVPCEDDVDPVDPCPADLTGDGVVNVFDLLLLLESWGTCADPSNCPADLNNDGIINVFDLLELLANWGACP